MTFAFFYRASLGGPDERREQKFATLVGESFRNVTHKYFTHTVAKGETILSSNLNKEGIFSKPLHCIHERLTSGLYDKNDQII
ncbi:hypothetical protein VC88_10645 [Geobacillus sp. A8]|nr:hypothetical protein VC88_10645 [Geobacillus sp. A8]